MTVKKPGRDDPSNVRGRTRHPLDTCDDILRFFLVTNILNDDVLLNRAKGRALPGATAPCPHASRWTPTAGDDRRVATLPRPRRRRPRGASTAMRTTPSVAGTQSQTTSGSHRGGGATGTTTTARASRETHATLCAAHSAIPRKRRTTAGEGTLLSPSPCSRYTAPALCSFASFSSTGTSGGRGAGNARCDGRCAPRKRSVPRLRRSTSSSRPSHCRRTRASSRMDRARSSRNRASATRSSRDGRR